MRTGSIRLGATAALLAFAAPAAAIDFELFDGAVAVKMVNKVSVGAGVRTQGRHIGDLGKLNTPGQQDLCKADDCLSFRTDISDTAPNQRLIDANGGFFLHAADDGDMNYESGDPIMGLTKFNGDWSANWGEWTLKANFVAFYDVVNTDFGSFRFNTVRCTGANPSRVCKRPATGVGATAFDDYDLGPDTRPRSDEIEERLALKAEFREYFLARTFTVWDHEIFAAVGNQRIRWGEANLTLLNTLDVINPQDAVLARQPGLALNELNLPTGLLTFGSDLVENVTLDGWIQYDWEPVRPEPSGSFFSAASDVAGGGTYGVVGLGQYPEDPDGLWFSTGVTGLISNSHRTIYTYEQEAEDLGQYGARLKLFLPDFNNGTEMGFYYANYHSRLPYLSAYAAQDSCLRNATNFNDAANRCNGFNAASNRGDPTPGLAPERCDPRGCNRAAYLAREPLPIDTQQLFLEYPEDIQMYGLSFNTTAFGWSFAGEYSYRPNLPVQVLISDVVFAATIPAIGRQQLPFVGPGAFVPNPGVDPATGARVAELVNDFADYSTVHGAGSQNSALPSADTIFPCYVCAYRGYVNTDPSRDIDGGQYFAGFERLRVGQFALTALQLFSTNPFGSDDLLTVFEVGFTQVYNMPDSVAFQGAGDQTHPSPGADGTGENDGNSTPQTTARINPTQQTDGFADDFAWGVRGLVQLNYSNMLFDGFNLKPTLLAFWDVEGIAPSPMQNYVKGNRWLVPAFFFELGSDWTGTLIYQYFAGERNGLGDRDNVTASVTYAF
jgi:hypothetical protein